MDKPLNNWTVYQYHQVLLRIQLILSINLDWQVRIKAFNLGKVKMEVPTKVDKVDRVELQIVMTLDQ